jgi:hypothetical protein
MEHQIVLLGIRIEDIWNCMRDRGILEKMVIRKYFDHV